MFRIQILFIIILDVILLVTCKSTTETEEPRPAHHTFYIEGRYLYNSYGDTVILRGVNRMVYYMDTEGTSSYPEIEKCGANVVRIFWFARDDKTVQQLDRTITNCRSLNMIPMIECHDATGKWENLWDCVNYWIRPDVLEVIKKHQRYLLLNIANEAGDNSVTIEQFRTEYAAIVDTMRAVGIEVPLIIDAAHWGRGEIYLLENAEYLLAQDPIHNLIFSWHVWDANISTQRIKNTFDAAIAMNVPFIVGEFGPNEGDWGLIPWRYIIEYCHQTESGWLAWSWGPGNGDPRLDMSTDGTYEGLRGWGLEAAVTSLYSIQNTAKRLERF
jgi:mannan endo-1,4-beta-mannosidase